MTRSHRRTRPSAPARPDVQVFTGSPSYSIGDPAFADFLRISGVSWGGEVNEANALGLTAFYRAVSLIAGTVAGLPLEVYQENPDDSRTELKGHWLDETPAGPYDMTDYAWVETVMLHQLIHGETFLKYLFNEAGELIGLWPVHPLAVTRVVWAGAKKVFSIAMVDGGTEILTSDELLHVPAMSIDGLRGCSPLSVFRQTLGTSRAGEVAANRTFTTGALIRGLVTTEEDIDGDEAKAIKAQLDQKMAGAENAGGIAFVNRSLKFSPWTMSNVDAQFLESRRFQVEEIARMYGLPTNLLSATGAVSNWGTGVAEANLGLQKYVFMAYTSRLESAFKRVLAPNQFAEFDYHGLLQGSPKDEIGLLIQQVGAGILTVDEARGILNLPPLGAPAPQEIPA